MQVERDRSLVQKGESTAQQAGSWDGWCFVGNVGNELCFEYVLHMYWVAVFPGGGAGGTAEKGVPVGSRGAHRFGGHFGCEEEK